MFSRGIVAAMEDEANATELAIDETGSDSMEADMVDVVDMSADIESGTDDMAQTVADADQLERHVEVLTDAEGEGGASPELIEATEIAVESIYTRLGIHGDTGIPALESFSTKTGRARSTRIAIETIGENIKKIWEAVKLAFKKMINFVKDFFAKLFDANAKMLARVNSLRAKVKTVKGTAPEKVKGSGIATYIESGTAGIDSADIGKAFKYCTEHNNDFKGMLGGLDSDAAFDSFSVSSASGTSVTGITAPEGFQWSEMLSIGTSKIGYLESKKGSKGKEAYEDLAKASVKTKSNESKGDGEIAGLSKDDALKVLNGVESAVKELMANKTTISKLGVQLEQAIADINSKTSQAGKDDENAGTRSTKIRSAISAQASAKIKLVTTIGSETTRVCQAYLTLVERSLSGHKEESSKDKK